jgi:hypothetical protein
MSDITLTIHTGSVQSLRDDVREFLGEHESEREQAMRNIIEQFMSLAQQESEIESKLNPVFAAAAIRGVATAELAEAVNYVFNARHKLVDQCRKNGFGR